MTIRKIFAGVAIAAVAGLLGTFAGAGPAFADRTITLTFVRSAESTSNAANLIDTSVPGPGLSPAGYRQAQDAVAALSAGGYDGIYASTMIRSQETAAPLAEALKLPVTVLPGLRQIEAGHLAGQPEPETHETDFTEKWLAGDRSARIPGGANGDEFDARFDEAVQAIYDSGNTKPIAFGHSASTQVWVLMNVKNPDNSLYITNPLPNMGEIVVTGSPQDGWTLTNWAGTAITQ